MHPRHQAMRKKERRVQHGVGRGQTKTVEEWHARCLSILVEPVASGYHQQQHSRSRTSAAAAQQAPSKERGVARSLAILKLSDMPQQQQHSVLQPLQRMHHTRRSNSFLFFTYALNSLIHRRRRQRLHLLPRIGFYIQQRRDSLGRLAKDIVVFSRWVTCRGLQMESNACTLFTCIMRHGRSIYSPSIARASVHVIWLYVYVYIHLYPFDSGVEMGFESSVILPFLTVRLSDYGNNISWRTSFTKFRPLIQHPQLK